jgi:hypothetical protein
MLWDQMVKGFPSWGIPGIVGAAERPEMSEYCWVRANGRFLVLLGMGPAWNERNLRARGDATTSALALLDWRRRAWDALEAGGRCPFRAQMSDGEDIEDYTADLTGR